MQRPAVRLSAIDLNLLVVFDAVMHERNVTRAAQRLGLSQPATSHALARLRHMLKDDLFTRTPGGMEPTPRAEELAQSLREALSGLEHAIQPPTFDPATARTHFRIGVDTFSALVLAHPFARHVLAQAPHALVDMRPCPPPINVLDLMDYGDLDLASGTFTETRAQYCHKTLLKDEFIAVLHEKHPAARKRELTLKDVAELPQIELTSVPFTTAFIDEALAKHNLQRRVVLKTPTLTTILLLLDGDFLFIGRQRAIEIVAPHFPLFVLRRLPMASPVMETDLIWPRRLDNHPAHQWLRQELCKVADALPRTVEARVKATASIEQH